MLFITGLLTLLAIAQAGGDHVKGGSRIKGGSVSQERVAQEDIIPSPFSIKTEAPYGTKVNRDGSGDPISKTAHSPALHHAVKTASDPSGKTHPSPGVHHAATSPVAQDQVHIDDLTSPRGIKTLKTSGSGKTRFSQPDPHVRDPVAHPVVQTVQTSDDPASGTVKTVKTVKTAGKTRFSRPDPHVRDPVAHPVVKTVQKTVDPTAGTVKTVKTLKTTGSGKTRFSQPDPHARDPVAHPVVQTVQTADDPSGGTIKTGKTLKTATTGKTRFSQDDGQVRDPAAHPVVQTVKTVADLSAHSVKTVGKTVHHSSPRTKTSVKTVKTAQRSANSQRVSNVPESIVSAARRNTMTATTHTTDSSANARRGIQLDEETFKILHDAGGITTENGEISMNEIGLEMLKNMGGGSISQNSPVPTSTGDVTQSMPILRTSELGQRQRVSSQNRRVSSGGRTTTSSLGTRSSSGSFQGSTIRGGSSVSTGSSGGTQSGIVRGPQSPVMLQPGAISGVGSPAQRQSQATRQRGPSRTSSGIGNEIRTSSRVSTETITRGSRPAGGSLTTADLSGSSGVLSPGGAAFGSRGPVGSGPLTGAINTGTVLFNGKEIDVSGLREGQIFDENLQPISAGATGSTYARDINILTGNSGATNAAGPSGGLTTTRDTATTVITRSGSTNLRSGSAQGMRRVSDSQRSGARRPSAVQTISTQTTGTGASGGLIRSSAPARVGGQTTATRTETVLFNGKEINIGGVREGQLFDENLQPISPGIIATQTGTQDIKPATRTIVRQRQQSVSPTSEGRKPVQTRPASRQRKPQDVVTSYTQRAQGQFGVRGSGIPTTITQSSSQTGGRGVSGGLVRSSGSPGAGRQTTVTTTRTEKVLFNGKEINIAGVQEGQLFDENLQPISPSVTGSRGVDVKASGVGQGIKPATRTVVRHRQQSVSSVAGGPKPGQTKPAVRQRKPQERVPGYTQTIQSNIQRQSTSRGSSGFGTGVGGGVAGQTVATRTETVLFNGKEINIGGVREGQLFDENLQPISPGAGSAGAITSGMAQNIKPATRTVVRHRQQTVSTVAAAPKPVQTRPLTRQRKPQEGSVTGYTQRIQTNIQRQTSSGAGAGVAGGIIGQTPASRTETVLFNGKEINIGGLREGQLFDENLQPISPGTGGASSAGVKASGITQNIKPATRTVVRQRTVSTISEAPKPVQPRPATRQRKPQEGTVASYAQRVQSTAQRSPSIHGSSGVGTGVSGVVRGQTVASRTETVLFNGKEINIGGVREGQLFDENLQPISPGAGGASSAGVITSGITQSIKPATRTVVRQRQQSVSTIDSARKPVQTRPVVRQRRPQEGGVAGYTQAVQSNIQRQSTIRGSSGVGTGIGGGVRGQTVASRTETVLFNGKEINIGGVREGQLFDENLQPISPGAGGASSAGVITSGITQSIKPATRTVVRQRQQSVSTIDSARKPVQTRPVVRQRRPQEGGVAGYTQAVQSNIQRQSTIQGSSGVGTGIGGGVRGQTVASRTETVLFNGKEINIGGVREGQLFDENLQPISPGAGGASSAGVITSGITQSIKPATRTVVRQRQQSVSTIDSARKPVQTRPVVRQRRPQEGGVAGYTQAVQSNIQRQSTILGSSGVGTGVSGGVRGQTVASRTETVLFNGKEINIGGVREGQLFDENLQPISPGAGGASSAGVITSGITQSIKPATRTVVRQRQQSVSTIDSARKPVQTKPVVRQRRPQEGGVAGYTQTVQSNIQRQSTIRGSSGVGTGVGGGVRGLTVASRTETVLFNGKEINIGGVREGQLFDENLQPISSGAGGASSAGVRTSGITQSIKPATRTVVKHRQQSVSSIAGAQKPGQTRPVTRQRKPQEGGVAGYTQTIQSNIQRQSTIGGSTGVGTGVGGGVRGQTVASRTETVLFNGKEINIGGVREGQLFDENLQPISPGAGGASSAGVITSGITQSVKPATRTVVRHRQQTVSTVAAAPKPIQTRPITRQRNPQESGATGYTQRIQTNVQRQSSSIRGSSGTVTGLAGGITGQTPASRTETVLFNGKEINIGGVREGQLFDENLQPISPGTGGARTGGVRTSTVVQNIKPATRTIVKHRQQTISSISEAPKPVQRRPVTRQRKPQEGVTGYTQRVQTNIQRQPSGIRGSSGSVAGQTPATRTETVLFNGKEINIGGVREGQIFDENLQPISAGGLGEPVDFKTTTVTQNIKPVSRTVVRNQPQSLNEATNYNQGIQRNVVSTRITGTTSTGAGSIVGPGGATGVRQQTTAINSGTVLFNGKEINIGGLQEGQLFDENLQPILPGGQGGPRPVDFKAPAVPQNIKPASRPGVLRSGTVTSRDSVTTTRIGSRVSSRPGTTGTTALRSQRPSVSTIQTSSVSRQITPVISRTSGARSPSSQGVSYSQTSPQTLGGASTSGSIGSLTSGTVLFNGKEISIDGVREGQIFDENLRPILSGSSNPSQNIGARSQTGSLRTTTITSSSTGPAGTGGLPFPGGISSSNDRTRTVTYQGSRTNLRNAAGLAAGSRTGTSSVRGSGQSAARPGPQAPNYGTLDSLGYIDVTRTGGSDVSPSTSFGNPISYGSSHGSSGSKIAQDRISQDQVEASVVQQKQDTSFLASPDFQQQVHESDPAIDQKQIQLKLEDVIQRTSPPKPVQQQEEVPFTISDPASVRKPFTRISQVSQKDIDIPTVQQKLMGGDFSNYLPKTSFLPPFNYAPPQLSQYRVKTPITQEQQKFEQIFV